MVLALCVLASTTVSFSCPPTALRYLVKDLGQVLDARLTIDAALQNEVVVVEAKEVSREELKTKLAGVVCGHWVESSSGSLRLTFDQAAEDAVYQRAEDKVAKAISEWRKSQGARYEAVKSRPLDIKQLAIDIQARRVNAQHASLPFQRLPFELIDRIPIKDLAARMILGQPSTYASAPTSLQLEISEGASLVDRRTRETSDLTKELRRMGFSEPSSDLDLATQLNSGFAPEVFPQDSQAILNFGGRQMRGLDHMLSILIDGQGRLVTPMAMIPSYRVISSAGGAASPALLELDLGPESQIIRQRLARDQDLFLRTLETEKLIVDMPSTDPISWYMGGSLNQWARRRDVDLVACLPDETLRFVANRELFYDLEGWLHQVDLEWTQEGSWYSLAPLYPWESRRDRADRVDFADYLSRVRTGGFPTPQDQVASLRSLRASDSDLWRYLYGSQPAFMPLVIGSLNHRSEKGSIITDLSAGTRLLMTRGVEMAWSQLPAEDQRLIANAACGRTGRLIYSTSEYDRPAQERDWRKIEPSIWMARPEMKNAVVRLTNQTKPEYKLAFQRLPEGDGVSIQIFEGTVPEGVKPVAAVRDTLLKLEIDLGGGVFITSFLPLIEAKWLTQQG